MSHIVLADDHPFIRSGVGAVLKLSGFTIDAFASDGEEALRAIEQYRPAIAVLDVQMPKMNGIETLRQLREQGDRIPVVLLTAMLGDEDLVDALRLDVRGIVFKDGAEDRLVECLNAVLSGRRYVDDELLRRALDHQHSPASEDPLAGLTPREREIAECVGKGLRNREIGGELGITEGTVKVCLNSIYNKLYLRNRTGLALLVNSRDR